MEYNVRIESVAAGTGAGVGRTEAGKVIFVDSAIPGQRVIAESYRDSERHAQAALIRVVEDVDRTGFPEACPHADACGGCRFQGVPYAHEVAWKLDAATASVRRLARTVEWPEPERIASPESEGWRTRVRWAVDRAGRIGYHAHRSHDVVEVTECNVLSPSLETVLKALSAGTWRGVTAIFAEQAGDTIGLEISLTSPGAATSVEERVRDAIKPMKVGRSAAAMTFDGRPALHLWLGGDALVRQSGQRAVKVLPGGFSQANALLLPELMKRVVDAVKPAPGVRVLELFAGFGQFSHALADAGAQVFAIEGSATAVKSGSAAKTPNLTMMTWDLSETLPADLNRRSGTEDVILVDPPRAGLGRALTELLGRRPATKLVYVSCDPATMARDAMLLVEAGWQPANWSLFDMYPRTHHVEALVVFERAARTPTAD
jgi:tRNA/tmRNA/rRNA uracil-C5-methylase (TrmA/RlmC/RlmD family)